MPRNLFASVWKISYFRTIPPDFQDLAKAEAKHFIILFRDAQLQFRALYGYSPDSEELSKLYGIGPRHITHKMYENLYK